MVGSKLFYSSTKHYHKITIRNTFWNNFKISSRPGKDICICKGKQYGILEISQKPFLTLNLQTAFREFGRICSELKWNSEMVALQTKIVYFHQMFDFLNFISYNTTLEHLIAFNLFAYQCEHLVEPFPKG